MSATNCPNCGAPLKGHRCSYCETEIPGAVSMRSSIDITASGIHMSVEPTIDTFTKLVNQAHMPPAWIRAMMQYQIGEEYS